MESAFGLGLSLELDLKEGFCRSFVMYKSQPDSTKTMALSLSLQLICISPAFIVVLLILVIVLHFGWCVEIYSVFIKEFPGTIPLLICTWFLKNRFWKIKLDLLNFLSISNLNFAGFIVSKNQVRNKQKTQIIQLDFSNSIFQK